MRYDQLRYRVCHNYAVSYLTAGLWVERRAEKKDFVYFLCDDGGIVVSVEPGENAHAHRDQWLKDTEAKP